MMRVSDEGFINQFYVLSLVTWSAGWFSCLVEFRNGEDTNKHRW